MAERAFTITELRRAGDGGLVDTPTKFVWTNTNRAAPRGSWRFGLQQRTIREDYPGVEAPVEQVLGPNFKDFSLQGIWDDRHNHPGYALETMRAFEALVQRGSLCRFEFETVSVVGLPKDADFDYRRASYIGYSFTVSPHYRTSGGISSGSTARRTVPEAFTPVADYRDQAIAAEESMGLVHSFAPKASIKGTAHADTGSLLSELGDAVSDLTEAIAWRGEAATDFIVDIKRVSNALNVVKGKAAGLITSVASLKSSTHLAYDNAVAALDFDAWRCGLSQYGRKLGLLGVRGRDELARRAEPKAVALYRPRKGESLYAISQKYYGTPSEWKTIATRNNLDTITLQGTELLIIPERR